VIDVGGHTLGHIAYVFDDDNVAFVGDALFALGCGRLFEGSPQQMWASLSKLATLPDDATLYCAHEYTQANARFAMSVDAANPALRARVAEIDRLRAANRPTVPMQLREEKATNPFLRAPELKASLGMRDAEDWEAFAEMRRRKDNFR
jgi:hydroxyacylglutathione hydrolase